MVLMKKIKFVKDDNAEDIEIIVKAKERNEEVQKILELLSDSETLECNLLSDKTLLDVNDIVIVSKLGRYTSIRSTDGEYVLKDPLYKIEEKLNKTWFVRISQSEIVNLKYVKKWDFVGGGIIKIELVNGLFSYTSRRFAVKIREVLKEAKRNG